MKIVKNLLLKLSLFTVIISGIALVTNMYILYSLFSSDVYEKARIQEKNIIKSIVYNYELGNLVRLGDDLDLMAKEQEWSGGRFYNSENEILWKQDKSPVARNKDFVYPYVVRKIIQLITNQQVDSNLSVKVVYSIPSSDGDKIGHIEFVISRIEIWNKLLNRTLLVAIVIILIWIIFVVIAWILTHRALRPLLTVLTELKKEGNKVAISFELDSEKDEISSIIRWFRELAHSWILIQNKNVKIAKLAGIGEVSSQVAHDIRSPLAALGMITNDLDDLEESKRIIIRGAVTRINDIANNLLMQSRETGDTHDLTKDKLSEEHKIVLLPTLIDSIMTEKRMQFRDKIGIKIINSFETSSYGVFCSLAPNEFKRVLSNLLNNAVEILGKKGRVTVSLSKNTDLIRLVIEDNGIGIPPEILTAIGKRGASYGKNGGNGLGLYHAIKSVESWGGTLKVESTVDIGTSVIINLPVCSAPNWFVSSIVLRPNMQVCILDDDESIHQIWDRRFSKFNFNLLNIHVKHFSNPEDLIEWHRANCLDLEHLKAIFLLDYELLGHMKTGLSIIKELCIEKDSYLVTSRYEDANILKAVEESKIGLIPKSMAAEIPILLNKEVLKDERKDEKLSPEIPLTVLLDDDPLIQMIWKHSAKTNNINLKTYADSLSLLGDINHLNKDTIFYIDSSLGNDVKGEDVAEDIYKLGYKNLHLATGYEASHFNELKHIKSIVGKEVPWPRLM